MWKWASLDQPHGSNLSIAGKQGPSSEEAVGAAAQMYNFDCACAPIARVLEHAVVLKSRALLGTLHDQWRVLDSIWRRVKLVMLGMRELAAVP